MGMAPMFFVSVASKGLSDYISVLESTLTGISTSVDSKGTYVAPKLCRMFFFRGWGLERELAAKDATGRKKNGRRAAAVHAGPKNTQGDYARLGAGKQGKPCE